MKQEVRSFAYGWALWLVMALDGAGMSNFPHPFAIVHAILTIVNLLYTGQLLVRLYKAWRRPAPGADRNS